MANVTLKKKTAGGTEELHPKTNWSQVDSKPASFTPASHTHGSITNDGKIGTTANQVVITGTSGALTTASRSGIDSRTSFPAEPHSHSEYVPTTRKINGMSLTGNLTLDTSNIGDEDRQQYLNEIITNLETDKLPTSDIIRSKNSLTTTSVGVGYSVTGLSVVLAANSTYKISMVGHWERQSPGTTAWAYRQSIISNVSGVYMRGMWTWYREDAYPGASTTVAYSDNMSSTAGATGQTVITPSETTAVTRAPMCFEGYVVTGASSATISFRHGTSTTVYPPTVSAFRGVLTAIKM